MGIIIDDILKMVEEYKSKVNDTSYVMFIDSEAYIELKDELDKCLFLQVEVTNMLPKGTRALVMTKKQYDDLFKSWD